MPKQSERLHVLHVLLATNRRENADDDSSLMRLTLTFDGSVRRAPLATVSLNTQVSGKSIPLVCLFTSVCVHSTTIINKPELILVEHLLFVHYQ